MNATEAALLAREHLRIVPGIFPNISFETIGIHIIDGGYQVECKVYSAIKSKPVRYVVSIRGNTVLSISGVD